MNKSKRQRPSIIFGEDISTEILLRLPSLSILKFKTVSKLWFSIVSSPRFRQTHVFRHVAAAPATGLFFRFDSFDFPINEYGFLTFKFDSKIKNSCLVKGSDSHVNFTCISSCNGLQLLKSRPKGSYEQNYFISNPTTKEYKPFIIPSHICRDGLVCASLAFDPETSLHYKVIFLRKQNSNTFQLEVYSSATGKCEAPVRNTFVARDFSFVFVNEFDLGYNRDYFDAGVFSFDFVYNRGIFCNGAIHWLSNDAISIVYFNVHTECINKLMTPGSNIHHFGESRGHLHLVNSGYPCFFKSLAFDVYELKRDYSGWFLKYQVKLASIAPALSQDNRRKDYATCLSIIRGEDDDSTMVLLTRGEWVEYNFKKKTTKRLCKFVPPKPFIPPPPCAYWFNTLHFIPTLSCV